MVTTDLDISDKEWEVLAKFREKVENWVSTHYGDDFLVRWLRARNWNPDASEHMLKDHLKWRKHWKVDDIENWKPPDVLIKYCPYGVSGYDKEGSPVIIVPFAGLDIVGMLHSVTKIEFIRYTIKTLERLIRLADKQSEKYGYQAKKLVVIVDMEGFTLKPYTWRPAGDVILTLIKMYEANYPEILKVAYIVNVPLIFSVGFTIVKNFLNDYTLSKIHIYKTDQRKWMPPILEQIDELQLPARFGGLMVDPDGDPRCPSKICQGGKVPRSCYRDKNPPELAEDLPRPYITTFVKKGSKVCLDFDLPKPGSMLKWEFHTECYDIKFGVTRLETNGTETEEIPLRRVRCQSGDEIGAFTSNAKGKYRVTFDNTYSYMRNKKVFHKIQVFPP